MIRHYTEREHDAALKAHGVSYRDMKRMAAEHGRDSEEYRRAREDVIFARERVSIVAQKPRL